MAALIAAMLLCSITVRAQESNDSCVARPVASIYSIDIGHGSVLDTYLTPVTYGGTNLRLGYSAMRATGFNPEKWVSHLNLGLEYDNVHNPPGSNTMHSLMVDAQWGMMHRWRMGHGLQLMAGGMATMRGGAIYNGQNSNNIVSVKIHMGVGLSCAAVYPVNLGRLPVTLSWQLSTPVAGAFYSLDYDESYYELAVGNRKGLVHPAWWGNRLEGNSLLSADLHLGNTIVRVGYRFHIEKSGINNLDTKLSSHALVLGVGGEFLSIGRKPQAKHIVSSMY